jgi:hypothetical protein
MEFTIGDVGGLGGEYGQCWNLVGVLSYYIKKVGVLLEVVAAGVDLFWRAVSEKF